VVPPGYNLRASRRTRKRARKTRNDNWQYL